MKFFIQALFLVVGATVAWFAVTFLVRSRWPARIPSHLQFEHELTSSKDSREIAEALAAQFKGPQGSVVCLGPVRGKAARVLFHSGPDNKGQNRNIHRPDYLLLVQRLGDQKVRLVLETNKPYSYLRLRRSEVEPLVEALRKTYGALTSL